MKCVADSLVILSRYFHDFHLPSSFQLVWDWNGLAKLVLLQRIPERGSFKMLILEETCKGGVLKLSCQTF